jgi:hypothetical protein
MARQPPDRKRIQLAKKTEPNLGISLAPKKTRKTRARERKEKRIAEKGRERKGATNTGRCPYYPLLSLSLNA